jgi:hypothetical protein
MSDASRKRRAERRAHNGVALSDEDRRLQLREDPVVQSLVAEALKNYAKQVDARLEEQKVNQRLRERDAFLTSLRLLVGRVVGGRVVITPAELAASTTWKLQTLFDKGTVVHYVIRDAQDEAAAAMREKAAQSGIVLP